MKNLILVFFSIMLYLGVQAQRQNNVWTFGQYLGLDFNSGSPVLIRDSCNTIEACAAVSDTGGKLLFYCDGARVFYPDNNLMLNGDSINGYFSSTQGVAIASLKGEDSVYFLFTLSELFELSYSIVDLRMNGGKGAVDPGRKNIFVRGGLSEKMIIVGNCTHQWLLVHHSDSATFYAYELGADTLASPVVSSIGWRSDSLYSFFAGEMKMSRDFGTLAMTASNPPDNVAKIQLFSFDQNTGIISNFWTLDSFNRESYGIEFSPDATKLYVTARSTVRGNIYQYDLSLSSRTAIRASKYAINIADDIPYYGMRLGPDDKIYAAQGILNPDCSCIRSPNQGGASCNFQKNTGLLPSTELFAGFGNYFVPRISAAESVIKKATVIDLCKGDTKELYGSGYKSYLWNDGSTYPSRIVNSATATYWLISTTDCQTRTDTFYVREHSIDSVHVEVDTSACFTFDIYLVGPDGFENYLWSNGSKAQGIDVFTQGQYSFVAMNKHTCEVLNKTYNVSFVSFQNQLRDTFLCNNDSVLLDANISDTAARYRWDDGDTSAKINVHTPGLRHVTISLSGCVRQYAVTVTQKELPLHITGPVTICGKAITLKADLDHAQYQWTTGDTTQSVLITAPGKYRINASLDGCTAIDEVTVSEDCKDCIAVFPTAFTPNNDGRNDHFKPLMDCTILDYQFKIFNRWGQEVFGTNNQYEGWNGRTNNQDQEVGTYFYLLKIKTQAHYVKEQIFKGEVTLLR